MSRILVINTPKNHINLINSTSPSPVPPERLASARSRTTTHGNWVQAQLRRDYERVEPAQQVWWGIGAVKLGLWNSICVLY